MGTTTQNSPAIRCSCAGSFAGGCYGRFGQNRRTCQNYPSQSAPDGSRPWQVNFGLATLGDFVKLLGNYCGTDCVLLVGGCFVCHKISTGKAVTSRDGTAQNVCNNWISNSVQEGLPLYMSIPASPDASVSRTNTSDFLRCSAMRQAHLRRSQIQCGFLWHLCSSL